MRAIRGIPCWEPVITACAKRTCSPGRGAARGGPLIEIVEVAEPAAHLLIAAEFYGTGIRALQVVHADDRGHWPWEVGYRGVRGGQPVLGMRANPVGGAS